MIRKATAGFVIIFVLTVLPPKKAKSEEFIASKLLYYVEDNDRIKVLAPAFLLQRESSDGWTIKVDGIYNSISGATPTGAPIPAVIVQPARTTVSRPKPSSTPTPPPPTDDDDGDDDVEEEDDAFISTKASAPAGTYSAVSAATPPPPPPPPPPTTGGSSSSSSGSSSSPRPAATPVPTTGTTQGSKVPTADFSDERVGVSVGVSKRVGRHTPGGLISYSTESDYTSIGLSLQDAIDFNKKNTTLLVGGAYTHDIISPANGVPEDTKRTVDAILGLTQVLSPSTLLTLNVTLGQVNGFISDPYKVVELNGVIRPEKRPDTKDKQIIYIAIEQFIAPLNGSAEISLRHYQDTFGITAETLTLEWFQKMGDHFILAPSIRYYDQTEADFYAVRFTGSPDFYSSDYRVSSFKALGYGLRLIWFPTTRLSLDIGVEQYGQEGKDGVTPQEIYPTATAFTAGVRMAL